MKCLKISRKYELIYQTRLMRSQHRRILDLGDELRDLDLEELRDFDLDLSESESELDNLDCLLKIPIMNVVLKILV